MSNENLSKSDNRSTESVNYRKAIRINGEKIEKRFTRKTDADLWYSEKKREKELVENGLSLPKEDITLLEYALKWLELRKFNGKPLSSW